MSNKIIAFALVLIALFAGVYLANEAGYIDLDGGPLPKAGSLFAVLFLDTSDTDRTENSELLSGDGHVLTYAMQDNDLDGLGDVTLDIRVTNTNAGAVGDFWAFSASISYIDFVRNAAGVNVEIVNRTDFNLRYAVTYSLTEAGSPTLTGAGDGATSYDWMTGLSDQLNIDLQMNPTGGALVNAPDTANMRFIVGGVTLEVVLTEAAGAS